MITESYKVHNFNKNISKIGLIRLYKRLLADKRIKEGGCAHRRLIKMMNE